MELVSSICAFFPPRRRKLTKRCWIVKDRGFQEIRNVCGMGKRCQIHKEQGRSKKIWTKTYKKAYTVCVYSVYIYIPYIDTYILVWCYHGPKVFRETIANYVKLCLVLYLLPWWTELRFGGWCKISSRISDVCSFKTFAYHVLHSLCTRASLYGIMQMIFFGGSWRCELYLLGTHISVFRYLQLYIYIQTVHMTGIGRGLMHAFPSRNHQKANKMLLAAFLRGLLCDPSSSWKSSHKIRQTQRSHSKGVGIFQLDLWHWRYRSLLSYWQYLLFTNQWDQ